MSSALNRTLKEWSFGVLALIAPAAACFALGGWETKALNS